MPIFFNFFLLKFFPFSFLVELLWNSTTHHAAYAIKPIQWVACHGQGLRKCHGVDLFAKYRCAQYAWHPYQQKFASPISVTLRVYCVLHLVH